MADIADLSARLAAVEQRLDQQAQLRAAQDRDLADLAATLRAQHHTIQALAINSSEHNARIDRLRLEHGERLQALQTGVTEILRLLTQLTAGDD